MTPRRRIKSPHVCSFWNLHQKAFPTTKSPRVPSFRECWTLCGFPLGAMWDQSQPFSCAGYAAFSCVGPTITCIQSRVRHVVADHPAPVLSVMIIAIGSVQSREKDKESRETESGGDMEALVGGGRMVSGCSVGEGLCMERCAGGAQDNAIINRIMLRFRPIAPKPAAGGSSSGGSTSENRNVVVARGRGKRKYVRVRKYNRCRRKKRTAEEEIRDGLEKTVQTLQLLPEKADGSDSPAGASWCNLERSETTKPIRETPPFWLTFNGENTWSALDRGVVREATMIVVESWVTVECVRSACMEGGGLGGTDLERRKNLERDTCPGLISDGLNKVEWVNDAYKRMVSQEISNGRWPECWVWLVAKEKLPYMYPAFTCRVRLQYTFGKEKHSQTVPCDAWRMDRGGFAWRLDVKAALSLGR